MIYKSDQPADELRRRQLLHEHMSNVSMQSLLSAPVGHDSSESLRGDDKSGSQLMAVGSGQSVAALERPPHDAARAPAAVQEPRGKQSSRAPEQTVSAAEVCQKQAAFAPSADGSVICLSCTPFPPATPGKVAKQEAGKHGQVADRSHLLATDAAW